MISHSETMRKSEPLPSTISIGIVSYNSFNDAKSAIASILSSFRVPDFLIIVENFQSPGAWAKWEGYAAQLIRIQHAVSIKPPDFAVGLRAAVSIRINGTVMVFAHSATNGGYCAGNNLARSLIQADFYMVLNPDCVLLPDGIEKLLLALRDPRAGVSSGALLRPAARLNDDGTEPMIIDARCGLVSRLSGRPVLVDAGRPLGQVAKRGGRMWLSTYTGACALFRTGALEQVGGFPEQYFLYYDELHLSQAMRAAKWIIASSPEAVAIHSRHGTTRGTSRRGQSALEAFHGARSAVVFAREAGYSYSLPWILARLIKMAANLHHPQVAMATWQGILAGVNAA